LLCHQHSYPEPISVGGCSSRPAEVTQEEKGVGTCATERAEAAIAKRTNRVAWGGYMGRGPCCGRRPPGPRMALPLASDPLLSPHGGLCKPAFTRLGHLCRTGRSLRVFIFTARGSAGRPQIEDRQDPLPVALSFDPQRHGAIAEQQPLDRLRASLTIGHPSHAKGCALCGLHGAAAGIVTTPAVEKG
jgi:hypothetical protein